MPVFLYFSVTKHNTQVFFRVFNIGSTFTGTSEVLWWQLLAVTNKSLFICYIANQKSLLCYFYSEEVPSQSRLFRMSV